MEFSPAETIAKDNVILRGPPCLRTLLTVRAGFHKTQPDRITIDSGPAAETLLLPCGSKGPVGLQLGRLLDSLIRPYHTPGHLLVLKVSLRVSGCSPDNAVECITDESGISSLWQTRHVCALAFECGKACYAVPGDAEPAMPTYGKQTHATHCFESKTHCFSVLCQHLSS